LENGVLLFRKAVSLVIIASLMTSTLAFASAIQSVKADGTVHINADGSITPSTVPISTVDDVTYTLADNIYDSIIVEKGDIIVNGNGYTVQGSGFGVGIFLYSVNNVTIKNANVTGFDCGIYIYSSCNTVSDNNVSGNIVGIGLCYSYNTLSGNIITGNSIGISSNFSSSNMVSDNTINENHEGTVLAYCENNTIYHNNFVNNAQQARLYGSASNLWNDSYPSGGNYWSDYSGVDEKCGPNQDVPGTDGIGDMPYDVADNNRDNYPLINIWTHTTKPTVYISVPYHSQINSYYCGPAALEMVFNFYDADIDQLEIGDVARTTSYGTYTRDMVRAAHFSNMSTSVSGTVTGYNARKLGYAAFEYAGMTINELKSLITVGYPVIVLTTWHFRVAVGYDSTHIVFQDSWYGTRFTMEDDVFDADWDYSGHWALLVIPWKIRISNLGSISLGDVVNVTASIKYPCFQPFYSMQYPAQFANATITLPQGLTLSSGETAEKIINNGTLTGGTSATVTWSVRADALGNYTISVEAEGEVSGYDFPIPPYPESYFYEDRIGGSGESAVTVQGPVHDVAVTNITADRTWLYQGFSANINATISNKGDFDENVNVTLYYNITGDEIISTQNITIQAGENETLSFEWNTKDLPYCQNYTLTAAATIPADYNPSDNTLACEPINVRIMGDINGDGKDDGKDLGAVAQAFASYGPNFLYPGSPPHPRWNPNADMNDDNKIDGKDLGTIASNFGKAYP
jgi:parallel beta-helix repeat protein